jgi:peptidoglycan hydrolase CwlO-like protein
LSIGQEALSSTSTALNGAQNDLSSLSNDFAKLNNDLQSTSDALKSVKEDVSPTCKQFLTGKKDLYHAYIKSGGLSVFDKKK